MTKHYIDRGSSASRIPKELINVFDETVFEYSKTVYTSLINKLEKVGVPFTDEGIINIEKIYEIIAKGAKGEYTEQTPETGLASIVLTVTNISPRILLSPEIKDELAEIVFAYSQGIYRALVDSYNYPGGDEIVNQYFIQEKLYHGSLSDPRRALLLDEGRKLLFYSNDKLDPEKVLSKITRIVSSKSLIPKPKHYTEISESGYDTDDIEDYEVDEDNRILIDEENPLLMRYIESNMVIGATNLIKRTGVDVNTKDEYGRSALFYANSLHAITMLLGQGADVNIIDKFGNNVLHIWGRKSLLFDLSKIQNHGLPLLHSLALNTVTNKSDNKNLELLKKLYEFVPQQLEHNSKIGNPLDIVLNRSETIEAPELQEKIISFFLEKGGKISKKTEIGKLNKHLGVFQEHIAKIAQIVSSYGFFPKEIIKIIIDYLPIFETEEENNSSISFSSSCSSGSSSSFSSSLSSSSSFSCSSSSSESYSSISPLSGEESSIELYHQD